MKIILKVEPCERLDDACERAQRIADTLGEDCEFMFNSVRCVAQPGGDASNLAELQARASSEVPTVYSDGRPI